MDKMKTNIRQITGLFAAALILLATGCTDENPIEDPTPQSAERIYILNDGVYGANNASLSVLDLKTGSVTADISQPPTARLSVTQPMTSWSSRTE